MSHQTRFQNSQKVYISCIREPVNRSQFRVRSHYRSVHLLPTPSYSCRHFYAARFYQLSPSDIFSTVTLCTPRFPAAFSLCLRPQHIFFNWQPLIFFHFLPWLCPGSAPARPGRVPRRARAEKRVYNFISRCIIQVLRKNELIT